jgi:SOS-response transcriptional repressor LexA
MVRRHKTIPIAAEQSDGGCAAAEAFALMVLGDSMAPEFCEGEVIIIEPEGRATDGSYVLAQAGGELIFRQLAREGERWLLRPVNPCYGVLEIADLSAVKGVIIQKSKPGRRKAAKRYVE